VASTANHIDIYDGSEVQPPSYLNVKDAPDHEFVDGLSSTATFVDGDLSPAKAFFESTASESRYEVKTTGGHTGYVNIDISADGTSGHATARRRPRDFGYSLSRSKSVCDISQMTRRDADAESVASSKAATLNRRANYDASSLASRGSKSSRVVRNRTILGSFPLFYKLSQSLSSLNTSTTAGTTGTRCASFIADFPANAAVYDGNTDARSDRHFFTGRVARFFFGPSTPKRENIPNEHKLYQTAVNYTK
jgi:hypothetical protein